MIEQVLGEKIKPRRLVIGYKMNLVAIIGQSLTQLGCNNAAAAKCWVTYYSYFHFIAG